MVDRANLWRKLLVLGISGRVFHVIKGLYTNTKSCVRSNNQTSSLFNCDMGVRQGDNLSPLLFSIYLNDLEPHLKAQCNGIIIENKTEDLSVLVKLFTLLYADDTILLSDSAIDLQNSLNALHIYCQTWKLSVNTSKTKVIVFSRGKVRKIPTWHFGSDIIESTDDYTYLGVTFNYNGSFGKSMSKQVNQAKRAMYGITSKVRKLQLPIDVQCQLFDSCVIPILLYGSEVWGFSDVSQLEVFHSLACKNMLYLHKNTANSIALGELGRQKLQYHITQRMLNYWARLVNGKDSKICHTVYKIIKKSFDAGTIQSRWLSKMKNALDNLGLTYLWEADSFNPQWFKSIISVIGLDQQRQSWHDALANSSLCRSYNIFKGELKLQPYLLELDKKYRVPLSRFRSGNHRLPITTGRYMGVDIRARICTLCHNNSVGDELHYIKSCPFFSSERHKLIAPRFLIGDVNRGISKLFNTCDSRQLTNLAKFVNLIMIKFTSGNP